MVLLWMILLEVLLCAEAENATEVRGQLGAEVNLTCPSGSSDTHWYMEIHSQLRAGIGRSLSSGSSYHSADFESKFTIVGNRLMIKNLTAEDCRLYYCGIRRDGSVQFVETFHLVSDVTLHTNNPQNHCGFTQLIIITSAAAAAAVALALGAVVAFLLLKRKRRRNNPSVHIYENAAALQAARAKAIHSQPAKGH